MTDTDPDPQTLPAPHDDLPGIPERTVPRWIIVLGVVAVVIVSGYVVLTTVRVNYFVQSPGTAIALEDRISVDGTPEFPSEGEVYFTTVRVSRDRATLLDVVGEWLDPASVLIEDERLLQGRSPEQNREFNRELMDSSQELAKRVALQYLGLDVVTSNGALVTQVQPDAPADGALEPGDVIVSAGGAPVDEASMLVEAIGDRVPGDELDLEVLRLDNGEVEPVTVNLAEREGGAFLGVGISDSFELTDLPFDVEIDTAQVGGPSAGLALTLSIIDLLTEGELTGGLRVATTGTIDIDGTVGPIGGIQQKAHAVRRAGIDVFIVPAADAPIAMDVLGDSAEVIGVQTLDEAIDALGRLGGQTEALALPPESAPA
jgi:PDZ domain-containing protein